MLKSVHDNEMSLCFNILRRNNISYFILLIHDVMYVGKKLQSRFPSRS